MEYASMTAKSGDSECDTAYEVIILSSLVSLPTEAESDVLCHVPPRFRQSREAY